MKTINTLPEAIQALTYTDHVGLLRISAGKFDPLNMWFLTLGWAGVNNEPAPEFSPAGWQTFMVRQSLEVLGNLAKLAGRNRLHRLRALCGVLIDLLLVDLHERRVL